MADSSNSAAADLLLAAKSTNQYITDYIKVADAKIAGYITISSAISALVLPNINRWLITQPITGWYQLYYFLFALAVVLFVGTLISAACALSPRVDAAKSLVSFPDIAATQLDTYISQFLNLKSEEIAAEYLKHNKTLSLIAMNKFKKLKYATNFCYGWISIYLFLYVIQIFSTVPK